MTNIASLLEALTPEQQQSLAAELLQRMAPPQDPMPSVPTPVTPGSTYYNMDDAVPVKFKADLAVSPKSRDTSYAERFDHLWCAGNYRVKGPKGGMYFVGRCVLGVKKGQQIKGTLRVGNKHFEPFLAGAPMDAWFRPDGEQEAILIGVLTNYRAV